MTHPPRSRTPARANPWAPTASETVVVVLAVLPFLLALLPSAPERPAPEDRNRETFIRRIDVANAGPAELMLLPGIGPHRARKILEVRSRPAPPRSPGAPLEEAGLPAPEARALDRWIRGGHTGGNSD